MEREEDAGGTTSALAREEPYHPSLYKGFILRVTMLGLCPPCPTSSKLLSPLGPAGRPRDL